MSAEQSVLVMGSVVTLSDQFLNGIQSLGHNTSAMVSIDTVDETSLWFKKTLGWSIN